MVKTDKREFNFYQGWNEIQKITNYLQSIGLQPNDRVAIIGENSPEHLFILFACAQLQAVMVPLNYKLSSQELDFIVKDAQIKHIVSTDNESHKKAETIFNQNETVTIDSTTSVTWEYSINQAVAQELPINDEPWSTVIQLYTSGTTGDPKGVLLSQYNLYMLAQQRLAGLINKPGVGKRELITAPMFHVGGLCSATNALLSGSSIFLEPCFNSLSLINTIQKNKITSVFMVPTMIYEVINKVNETDKIDFSSLERITYGAAPITESLLKNAISTFECEFVQYYGMTETCGAVLSLTWEDHLKALDGNEKILQSCGRTLPGVKAHISQSKNLDNITENSITGELIVHSQTNTEGYWGLPTESNESIKSGWVHTGDVAYIDDDGYYYLRDRLKNMVITGGENVYPAEVENILSNHPKILELAIIGIPNEKYGEALLAIVVLYQNEQLTVDELVEYCKPKIASYKIPREMVFLDSLPKSDSGKTLKKELISSYG